VEGDFFEVEFRKLYGFYRLLSDKRYKINAKHCIVIVIVPCGTFECEKKEEPDFSLATNNLMVIMAYHNLTRPR